MKNLKPLDILVVDDNELDIELIRMSFEADKILNKLYTADDGEEAICFLEDKNNPIPDVIFLDINMPRVSGLETLEYIKSSSQFNKIKVVILSGSDSFSDTARAEDLGASFYLLKPLNMKMMMHVVKSIEEFGLLFVRDKKDA
jgi:CheY-like chemotaxis protein